MVHHAHIEDEQRIKFIGFDDFRRDAKEEVAFSSSLELAVTWLDDFRLGSEIFIPLSNTGSANNQFGLGDIEIQPLKYALLNQPETVITAVLSFTFPTGDESAVPLFSLCAGFGGSAVGESFSFRWACSRREGRWLGGWV